jgi:HD-GYP domain-containing protein (c-di-GMP phosphodiesterase class II)
MPYAPLRLPPVAAQAESSAERVRTAEVTAAVSLATDLQLGLDLEHGLRSAVFAMRIGERLGVDRRTLSDTYHACVLMYVGCTADVHIRAELFDDIEAAARNLFPVMFGSSREALGGLVRSVAPGRTPLTRAASIARTVPRAARVMPLVDGACREVAGILSGRLGLPDSVRALAPVVDERWDGKGEPGLVKGDQLPLSTRIAHIARDADLQRMLGGWERAARVLRERAGGAFDPVIATLVADHAAEILAIDEGVSAWEETLACEPTPHLMLEGEAIDTALSAMGDFADLVSPYLTGHSTGVAELASAAAQQCGMDAGGTAMLRRAALVHDVGRAAVPTTIWQKPGRLTPQEWERVRLHPYHSERILCPSAFLAALVPIAAAHHERLDGSGYHRGTRASELGSAARVLACADAYHAMTEPRPHRAPLSDDEAAIALGDQARTGALDPEAVVAVLEAAGHRPPRFERPAGLTDREAEVVGLLARGLQTKHVAHTLGISVKTADTHVQHAYAKIGVSTRAGATLFAMQHGLVAWADLPHASAGDRD